MTDLNSIPMRKVLDIGIGLDNQGFGTAAVWDKATGFAEAVGSAHNLECTSAGTGFGIRDMQFKVPDDDKRGWRDWNNLVREMAKGKEVKVEYVGLYFEHVIDGLELSDEDIEELFEMADTKTSREL